MKQNLATTKMSSRGQVVIPESIREKLGLEAGVQFAVVGQDDVVMLKVVTPPSIKEYTELTKRLRKVAREAGLKRADIPKAIAKVRGRR
jgi:AbrB family looped-hinge helix DNA binding protein